MVGDEVSFERLLAEVERISSPEPDSDYAVSAEELALRYPTKTGDRRGR